MVNFSFSLDTFEYLLMIFVRIVSFMFIAPFFSTTGVPARVKVGFSFIVSILLLYTLPKATLEYDTVIQFASIILKEATVGLLIGFAANICTSIVQFAGRIIDMDMGLSMMTLFDPISKENASITGSFYYYLVLLLLIVTDMHHFILRALTDSYKLIPVNGVILNVDHLYDTMVSFMSDYIVIGFRIALPVFACMLILNVILGILAKVAPQMNMFAVGLQLKLILGMGVLFLTIGLLPDISNFIFTEIKTMMVSMIEGLY